MASMAAASPTPTPTLSFPRPIFAAISPHPFLQAHLSSSKTRKTAFRANGRTIREFRPLGVHTGSLTHGSGSAVVRLGHTSVVCGVRAEVLRAEEGTVLLTGKENSSMRYGGDEEGEEDVDDAADLETLRLLVPNIELATGSTPAHIPGSAPTTYAQTLITRLYSLLLSTRLIRLADLIIPYKPPTLDSNANDEPETQIKAYWTLYLDIWFIGLDGNAFDAAWLAVLAALRDTRIPRAWWDDETEGVLCSDELVEARSLSLRGFPVPCTFAMFEGRGEGVDGADEEEDMNWLLSDPDAFEEGLCRETVCVVVDCEEDGKWVVRRIEKSGGGVVGGQGMRECVERAAEKWRVVRDVLNGSL